MFKVIIKGDEYRVDRFNTRGPGAYIFHKEGLAGHQVAASSEICNCLDYYQGISRSPAYACKHMEAARKLDREGYYVHSS